MPNTLIDQIRQALNAFTALNKQPALIGGLALAAHNVVRATSDVDFLVHADDGDRLHELLLDIGYRCRHRDQNSANYVRGNEGLDLLFARREESIRLLENAQERDTPFGRLRVVGAEGLIAFKLQAYGNDSYRARDLDDIRELIHANHQHLDMQEVRRYFEFFEQEALLNEILSQL